ncbi:MAG: glycosyltransferase [Candidatus Marinimicrobia bacterium]|nr:glycosyltransferase [Candidatus Neomarinimicrobiota bacterium]
MPHRDPIFGMTVSGFKLGHGYGAKYSYLIRELINDDRVSLSIVMQHKSKLGIISKIREFFEIREWCRINHIDWSTVNVFWSVWFVRNQPSIFFASARRALMDNPVLALRSLTKVTKVFHMTHFMVKTAVISKNMDLVGADYIISETQIEKTSSLFRRMYPNRERQVRVLPFVPADKFIVTKPFSSRNRKACVAGSLTFFSGDEDYLSDFFLEYKVDTYHPMRKKIYECVAAGDCEELISSQITIVRDGKRISKSNSSKFYDKLDVVDFYNHHMIAISPEEIIGVPSIGFVEAMACGCAFIGLKSDIYTSLGMIPGVHYLEYDGNIESLKGVIRNALSDVERLREIAMNGNTFIKQNFNGAVVAKMLIDYVA